MATALYGEPVTADGVANKRQRCADLLRRATGPMHVPQPGGKTLRLCFVGRLQRIHEAINGAAPDKRPALLAKEAEIVQEANDAITAWKDAEQAYINACTWAGVVVDLPTEQPCTCAVCSEYQRPTVHWDDGV